MTGDNKKQDYSSTVVIVVLSVIIIALGIAYNSLRNENCILNGYLEMCEGKSTEEVLLDQRIKKLEDMVFKQPKRK